MSQYEDSCKALGVAIAANVPVILWGDPGQGKTSVINQIGADLGLPVETVIAAIHEPSDFNGLPVVNPTTAAVNLAPPNWAKNLRDAGKGILFLDEVSTAPPAVQKALLRPVLERVVGDLRLPDQVRIIAAANPPDIAADGWDLPLPSINRFLHLNWKLTSDVVREGFSIGWPSIDVPHPDPQEAARLFADAKVLAGAFVTARPELLTRVPQSAEDADGPFPSPRSWEMVALLYAVAQASGVNSNVVTMLLVGSVGVSAANEFLTYVANLDLPDPEKLLADPDSFTVPRDRGDKVHAVAMSVLNATLNNLTSERWTACGVVLAHIAEHHADIAYITAKPWAGQKPKGAAMTPATAAALMPIMGDLGVFEAR